MSSEAQMLSFMSIVIWPLTCRNVSSKSLAWCSAGAEQLCMTRWQRGTQLSAAFTTCQRHGGVLGLQLLLCSVLLVTLVPAPLDCGTLASPLFYFTTYYSLRSTLCVVLSFRKVLQWFWRNNHPRAVAHTPFMSGMLLTSNFHWMGQYGKGTWSVGAPRKRLVPSQGPQSGSAVPGCPADPCTWPPCTPSSGGTPGSAPHQQLCLQYLCQPDRAWSRSLQDRH